MKKDKGESIFHRFIKQLAFFIVRQDVKFAKYRYGLNKYKREQKIIISMTSYPQRFGTIILPLKSLLMQSVKPDRIIVWLGSDSSPEMITKDMHKLEEYGIEYRFDKTRNIKPHKKYFYALQEFKNDIVITVDDDIIYPRTLVKSLLKVHQMYPDAICARRVHRVKFDDSGMPLPYSKWGWEDRTGIKPDSSLLATNGAGSLFPPNSLDERAFDVNAITDNCLDADDIWLWYMEKLKGVNTVWVPCLLVHPPVVKETWKFTSLANSNVEGNKNDIYLRNLINKYGVI